MIPAPELAAVNYVRQNTNPDAVFLLAPSQFNTDNLWFTALSGRRVVYAGFRFEQQIGVDPAKILTWIRRGELHAINVVANTGALGDQIQRAAKDILRRTFEERGRRKL